MRKKCTKLMMTAALFYFLNLMSWAQEKKDSQEDDFDILSIEELMNIPVSVASNTEQNQRESPGIISVITEREIRNMGARDLIDVLNMIPGVSMGKDVQGTTGFGLRGNWGYEGKVLILLDGVEMNETLFATTAFGNRFNINSISRVEVIRGPGSSIYGGFAELGVINIITKKGNQIRGGQVDLSYGQVDGTYARRNLSFGAGNEIGDFEFSIHGMLGQGGRSNQNFTDINDTTVSLLGNSQLDPAFFNTQLKYKDLSLKLIYENYRTTSMTWFGEVEDDAPFNMSFSGLFGELKYDYKLNDKITIVPRFEFKTHRPWYVTEPEDEIYTIRAERYRGNITARIQLTDHINLQTGFDTFYDYAIDLDGDPDYFGEGLNSIGYLNLAGFAQMRIDTDIANFTAGMRYDEHSEYGGAFSPRLGITKVWGKLHTKLLYNRSFRAPGIENINFAFDGDVVPERTQVFEFEMGYQLSSKMFLTANLFDITIYDPIIYFVDEDFNEGYENFNQTGTRGFDIDYRFKDQWGYFNLNFSFYTANGKNEVDVYAVPGQNGTLMGMPNHRLNLSGNIKLYEGLSLNPTFNLYGERYSVTGMDNNDDFTFGNIDPQLFINLFINYRNLGVDGLDIGLGIYDLLNQRMQFIQPYAGGHLPMRGNGREIMLRLNYKFNW